MVISHNLLAMNAQRQFNITGTKKKKSTEKLASGYKINRAADDAAGLAISEKMRRQIRGLDQGARNTQDGISLLQVADGALNEVHDMLHRVTELSVQAANGTNTTEDRKAIQQEIGQIMSEINRISDTTEFNERLLFQGANGTTVIPAEYAPTSINSFTVSGTPTDTTPTNYKITADSSGFRINGEEHNWNEFTNGSNSLSDSPISAGTYSFDYRGFTLSVNADNAAIIDDAIKLLNGASFSTRISAYDTEKITDIMEIKTNLTLYQRGFDVTEGISIKMEDGKIVLHTGMTDQNKDEILFKCDTSSDVIPAIEDDDKIITSGTDVKFRFWNDGYVNGSRYEDLVITALKDTKFSDIVKALEKGTILYSQNATNEFIGLDGRNERDPDGGFYIHTSSINLINLGYDYYSVSDGISFTKKSVDGVDAIISDDNRFVFKYDGWGLICNYYYTEDRQNQMNYDRLTTATDFVATINRTFKDSPWYEETITGISLPDITLQSNAVVSLEKYTDSGYKGTLLTPEERIHSDGDLNL